MEQQELPLALVRGEALTEKPADLFIPDYALEVHLDEFEGPLDLLLYLIKKQKFDIADLPIAPISQQYLRYIQKLEQQDMDLSSEYLVMAATLAHIKSKLLLPKPEVEEEEQDPRAELVKRLQEYQRIKQAAELLGDLPRDERDFFTLGLIADDPQEKLYEEVSLADLVNAFQQVIKKQTVYEHHHIQRENISTHDKIEFILDKLLEASGEAALSELVIINEGRQGVVVTFLALLELIKQNKIIYKVEQSNSENKHVRVVLK